MVVRRLGAVTVLLIGLSGAVGEAAAQYYPAQRVYPPYRPLPPIADADDDEAFYDPPMIQGRQLPPPVARGAQAPNLPYGHRIAADDTEPYVPAPPPGYIYREPPRGYERIEPGANIRRAAPPAVAEPVEPPPAAAVPPAAAAPPVPGDQQDALRPPMPIGPAGQPPAPPQDVTGSVRGADPRAIMSALPPDYRPETGPKKELPAQFRRNMVDYHSKEPAGTIIIDTPSTYLYLVLGGGKAMRYGIGVGREGFTWAGVEKVSKMAEWPDWHPPDEMIERQPYLPRFMAGGEGNPLGARALYLGKTLYRIHGTNQPSTIGTFVSSGCIRLTNEDIADLYTRVKVGTRVVVRPGGKPPAQASAVPPAAQAAVPPAGLAGPPDRALPPPPFVR